MLGFLADANVAIMEAWPTISCTAVVYFFITVSSQEIVAGSDSDRKLSSWQKEKRPAPTWQVHCSAERMEIMDFKSHSGLIICLLPYK